MSSPSLSPTSSINDGAEMPLTLRPAELAGRLGLSVRQVYYLVSHPDPSRRLPPPFKLGRMTMWRVEDIQRWLTEQAAAAQPL